MRTIKNEFRDEAIDAADAVLREIEVRLDAARAKLDSDIQNNAELHILAKSANTIFRLAKLTEKALAMKENGNGRE